MTDKRQQWFFLWLLALWLVLSLIAPVVVYLFTRTLLCFAGYAGAAPPAYLLCLLAKRLFPPGDNETVIALAKHHKKRRVL